MTVVCKLGGSVVTRKDEPETVDEAALAAVADAVADALEGSAATDRRADAADLRPGDLLLVHGGGSFGHHHADEHGVSETVGTADADAAGAIHDAVAALNRHVVTALRDRGVPALPVHPLSTARRDADGDLALDAGAVAGLAGEGFVPVLHGDVIAHEGEGVTVLSGDEIVADLARSLAADRVGLCSTVPGVLDGDGHVIDRIDDFDAVASALGESDATDVTGGMAGKVRRLLALDAPAHVFGPDELGAFLGGGAPGTTIDGS